VAVAAEAAEVSAEVAVEDSEVEGAVEDQGEAVGGANIPNAGESSA